MGFSKRNIFLVILIVMFWVMSFLHGYSIEFGGWANFYQTSVSLILVSYCCIEFLLTIIHGIKHRILRLNFLSAILLLCVLIGANMLGLNTFLVRSGAMTTISDSEGILNATNDILNSNETKRNSILMLDKYYFSEPIKNLNAYSIYVDDDWVFLNKIAGDIPKGIIVSPYKSFDGLVKLTNGIYWVDNFNNIKKKSYK